MVYEVVRQRRDVRRIKGPRRSTKLHTIIKNISEKFRAARQWVIHTASRSFSLYRHHPGIDPLTLACGCGIGAWPAASLFLYCVCVKSRAHVCVKKNLVANESGSHVFAQS